MNRSFVCPGFSQLPGGDRLQDFHAGTDAYKKGEERKGGLDWSGQGTLRTRVVHNLLYPELSPFGFGPEGC